MLVMTAAAASVNRDRNVLRAIVGPTLSAELRRCRAVLVGESL
jgi:hypothetical protein